MTDKPLPTSGMLIMPDGSTRLPTAIKPIAVEHAQPVLCGPLPPGVEPVEGRKVWIPPVVTTKHWQAPFAQ